MVWLLRLLLSWRLRCTNAWARAFCQERAPTRVGVLDSGELILVADTGQAQIISAQTAQLVLRTLTHHQFQPAPAPPANRRKPLRAQSRA